jgi:CheY-like chemotaxis protein
MDGYEVNSPFHPPDQYLMLSTNHDIKNSRPRRSLTEIYKATQRIRSYEKKHQIPASKIIALTALGSEAAYKEAFGSGCDMFLTKPVKLKDLTKIIEGGGESA